MCRLAAKTWGSVLCAVMCVAALASATKINRSAPSLPFEVSLWLNRAFPQNTDDGAPCRRLVLRKLHVRQRGCLLVHALRHHRLHVPLHTFPTPSHCTPLVLPTDPRHRDQRHCCCLPCARLDVLEPVLVPGCHGRRARPHPPQPDRHPVHRHNPGLQVQRRRGHHALRDPRCHHVLLRC